MPLVDEAVLVASELLVRRQLDADNWQGRRRSSHFSVTLVVSSLELGTRRLVGDAGGEYKLCMLLPEERTATD